MKLNSFMLTRRDRRVSLSRPKSARGSLLVVRLREAGLAEAGLRKAGLRREGAGVAARDALLRHVKRRRRPAVVPAVVVVPPGTATVKISLAPLVPTMWPSLTATFVSPPGSSTHVAPAQA